MITRERLSNLAKLELAIESTREKLRRLKNNPPSMEYDKAYGSSSEFPYTPRSFSITGYNGSNYDKWCDKVRVYNLKLQKQLHDLEREKIELDMFISDIPDLCTRLIFTYIYIDGMTQNEVAQKLRLEQCTISKRISRHIDAVNKAV